MRTRAARANTPTPALLLVQGIDDKQVVLSTLPLGRRSSLKSIDMAEEPQGMKLLRILIAQIRGNKVAPGESLSTGKREITASSLKVLIAILEDCGEDTELLEKRQNMLSEMGGSIVALMMASCMDDDLSRSGLDFAVALLKRGNKGVQQTMRESLMAT